MSRRNRPRAAQRACVCDWPEPRRLDDLIERCNGAGVICCEGCGGDLCVCVCGGSRDCPGCDACDAAKAAYSA
jgi:hypothetical protein